MHSDRDGLAAMAMGETDVSADDIRHIELCEECAWEIRSLRRVAELARSGPAEEPLLRPDDAVWSRISATLALAPDVVPEIVASQGAGSGGTGFGGAGSQGAASGGEASHGAQLPASTPEEGESDARLPAPVADLRRHQPARRVGNRVAHRVHRRGKRWVLPIAVAASVVLIAGVAGGVSLLQRPTSAVLADVRLDSLPDWAGSTGDARIERSGDGRRDVVVTLQASAPTSDAEYREVWLLSADLTKLVSVGVLTGDSGSFDIPDGVDLREYPIVDVSHEKLDGDPAHSGDSIVRGEIAS